MPVYEFTGDGAFRVGGSGELVASGETVELDAHAGDPHPELVEVEPDEDEADGGGEREDNAGEDEDEALDLSELTIGEIETELEDGDYSVAELEELLAVEEAGEARVGAIDALESAIEAA